QNNILPTFLQTNIVTTEAKEITSDRVKNPRACNFGDRYKYLDMRRSGWKLLRAQKSWRISTIPASPTISSSRVRQRSEGGTTKNRLNIHLQGRNWHQDPPRLSFSSLFPLPSSLSWNFGEWVPRRAVVYIWWWVDY
ncbi:unnamed protein product, partial [Musa textilis]